MHRPSYLTQMIVGADITETLIAKKAVSTARPTVEDHVSSLYGAHREAIYRFLDGRGISFAAAQDLAQEVFVRLFVALSKRTEMVSEQAWMYSVASKLAIDYWRREGRRHVGGAGRDSATEREHHLL